MIRKERKKSVRFFKLAFVLLLAVLMLVCVACKKDELEDTEKSEADSLIADLLVGNLNAYQTVRSETMKGDELKAVSAFIGVIQKNGYEKIAIVSDYVDLYPVIDTEIIIGETTRKGSIYNDGEGAIVQKDNYSIYIVEKRLIVTYTDNAGLMDCLEYLLICSLDMDEATAREMYSNELFQRGVRRVAVDGFSVKNYINKGSVLSANEDMLWVGTSTPNSKITVKLTKGDEVVKAVDAVTDANGVWQANVTPDTSANSISIRVDGNLTERFENVSFKMNEITRCSEGTSVYINGKQVDVYANKGGNYVVSSLAEGEEKMEIKLVRTEKVNECTVRPISAGVEPKLNDKEITFTVTEFPCKLSVEFEDFSDNTKESVQLFLYSYEKFTPDLNNRDLMYFAPGEYWINTDMSIASNTTLYLAEGAVLHAKLRVNNAENVTVMGRGIIDTYTFVEETNMSVFEGCKNLILKDYTIIGPRKWMTVLSESDTCRVDSVNILGTEVNSDGIDIVGSKNVSVINCFLRTNDDCVAIKSGGSDVMNVVIKGCVMWNENYGNALEIGFETRCDTINNVTFEDNDLIYVNGACMSIHLGDRAHVKNIKYKDIRVENLKKKLIEYYIKETQYTQDKERGKISDVSIDGIVVLDNSIGSISFKGYDSSHSISGVVIGKIKFKDKYLTDISNIVTKDSYSYDISYDGKVIK